MVQIVNNSNVTKRRERKESFRSMAVGLLVGWATMFITMMLWLSTNQHDYYYQHSTLTTPASSTTTSSFLLEQQQTKVSLSTTVDAGVPNSSRRTINPEDKTHNIDGTNSGTLVKLDLVNEALGDRTLPEASLDLHYTLQLKKDLLDSNTNDQPTFDKVMAAFHTKKCGPILVSTPCWIYGICARAIKRMDHRFWIIHAWIGFCNELTFHPLAFLSKLGSFVVPANAIQLAEKLDDTNNDALKPAFIICIDTWLLDLRYVWPPEQMTGNDTYFQSTRVAGHEFMFFLFLANVIIKQKQHRIIPLPSSSLNGALALIAKIVRPDFIYLDASHANPDVYLDLINFWTILNPHGGVLVADDYKVAQPVQAAVQSFQERFAKEIAETVCHQNQCWIYKQEVAAAAAL